MFKSIVLTLMLSASCFAADITATQFVAIKARSAKIEQAGNGSVLVLLDRREVGEQTGAFLSVKSEARFVSLYSQDENVSLKRSKNPDQWILLAPFGKHRILVIESDPESEPQLSVEVIVIGKVEDKQDKLPIAKDLARIAQVSAEEADKVNDTPTRKALANAYSAALELISSGQSIQEMRKTITTARVGALNARSGDSLNKDWNGWLMRIDAEVNGYLGSSTDGSRYRQAIQAVQTGLAK